MSDVTMEKVTSALTAVVGWAWCRLDRTARGLVWAALSLNLRGLFPLSSSFGVLLLDLLLDLEDEFHGRVVIWNVGHGTAFCLLLYDIHDSLGRARLRAEEAGDAGLRVGVGFGPLGFLCRTAGRCGLAGSQWGGQLCFPSLPSGDL